MITNKEMYKNEIELAREWVIDHNTELKLTNWMFLMKTMYAGVSHSDRWSMVYDFISENYPEANHIITGLTYFIEE